VNYLHQIKRLWCRFPTQRNAFYLKSNESYFLAIGFIPRSAGQNTRIQEIMLMYLAWLSLFTFLVRLFVSYHNFQNSDKIKRFLLVKIHPTPKRLCFCVYGVGLLLTLFAKLTVNSAIRHNCPF